MIFQSKIKDAEKEIGYYQDLLSKSHIYQDQREVFVEAENVLQHKLQTLKECSDDLDKKVKELKEAIDYCNVDFANLDYLKKDQALKIIDRIFNQSLQMNARSKTSIPFDSDKSEDNNPKCICGHKRPQTIILDCNELSMTEYLRYWEQRGILCWDCFIKDGDEK